MKKHLFIALAAAVLMAGSSFAEKLTVNEPAPDFTLTDSKGGSHSLSDFRGKYVVLEWINHGCPFVVKHYSEGHMQALQKEYTEKGVVWLAICSSAEGKQGYMTNEEWEKTNAENGTAVTAVLVDAEGTVGKLYSARTTPHMYVISPDGNVIYQGAIDSIKSTDAEDIPKADNYVVAALTQHMAGEAVANADTPPYGCSVKYKD